MSHHPTIAIVGSGPIGATYARTLLEGLPDARVIMFEAGPQITERPGESVRNIDDPDEKARARELSQGPQAGDHRESLGIPSATVVEGMFTARQGTHLFDFGGEGSAHAPTFAAAAGATNVGGQGSHWTCATPSPAFSEKIPFIADAEWDELIDERQEPAARAGCRLRGFRGGRGDPLAARRRSSPTSFRTATASAPCRSPATRSRTDRCAGAAPTSCSARSSIPRRR